VNENTQQISKVSMTTGGPQAIKNLNPFVEQQAETMATAGGISYESFTNITKAPSVSNLGNDASQNLQVSMSAGSWTMLRSVDFGEGAQSFTLKASGTGKMEIRFNSISALTSATIEFSSTGIEEHTIPLDANIFKGVKKVFFVFTEASNVKFDAWQFSESLPVGIEEATASSTQQSEAYTLSGVRLQKEPAKGIYIKGKKKYVKK
jgi:arabinoxylan arabinofuranohydrolase